MVEVLMNVSRAVFQVPGCVSYVVSNVASEPGAVFISEIWDTRDGQRSAFAMSEIFEPASAFHVLAARIEQHELIPLMH